MLMKSSKLISWNPVKELKVDGVEAQDSLTPVESGEGIESQALSGLYRVL